VKVTGLEPNRYALSKADSQNPIISSSPSEQTKFIEYCLIETHLNEIPILLNEQLMANRKANYNSR